MSQVVARPYAKALFEHAVATKSVAEWAGRLLLLKAIVLTKEARDFLSHPLRSLTQQTELLLAPFGASKKKDPEREVLVRWVTLLLSEGRVLELPEIADQYHVLQAEFEKNITVKVRSFSTLSASQKTALVAKLEARLKRQVVLEIEKDKSLLGGMVIQAGDWVLDGSVRGKLKALYTDLCA